MFAVYKKELKLWFSSLSTYLILGAFLLSLGVFITLFNLYLGYSSLSYALGYMTALLHLFLPLLLLFSALRSRGDGEKLLFSLPLRPIAAVMGTFSADVTVVLIPTACIACLPFLFTRYGDSPIATSLSALFGFFLYEVFLLALIRSIFTAVRKKAIAVPLAFGISLLLYGWNRLCAELPLDGWAENLLLLTDPVKLCYSFTYGKFYLPGVFCFGSAIAFFLFLQVLFLRKAQGCFVRAESRRRISLASGALGIVLLFTNFALTFLPERISDIDVTGSNIFRMSGQSLDLLQSIEEPIRLYYLCDGGKGGADGDIYSFLKRYEEECASLTLEIVDTQKDPTFSATYTSRTLNDQSLIFVSEKRYFVLDSNELYHYENKELGLELSPTDYVYLLQTYLNYKENGNTDGLDSDMLATIEQLYYSTSTVAYFDGDSRITNAVRYVSEDRIPTVCILTGDAFTAPDSTFEDLLTENGFFIRTVSDAEEIPSDCALLILFSPKSDPTVETCAKVERYLASGGNLFLTTDYSKTDLPNLAALLDAYGLAAEGNSILCEENQKNILNYHFVFYPQLAVSDINGTFSGKFTAVLPHAIKLSETSGVTLTAWMTTTENGYLLSPDAEKDTADDDTVRSEYCCGALSEKEDGGTVLWLAAPLSASSTGNTLSSGNNFKLLLSAFGSLTDTEYQSLSIPSVQMTASSLNLTGGERAIWILVLIALLPLAVVGFGCARIFIRKRR